MPPLVPKSSLLFRLCVAVVIFSLLINLLWFISYKQNNNTIQQVRQAVASYNTQQAQTVPYPYLTSLLSLHHFKQETTHNHLYWFADLLLPKEKTAKNLAAVAYQRILESEFLPDLQMILDIEIQSSTLQNPSDLYSALKVYLMLSNNMPRNPHYIEQWFNHYWQRTLPDNTITQQKLNQLLTDSLRQHDWKISPNSQLIQQARTILRQMPPAQLSVTILEDQNSHLPILPLFDAKIASLFNGKLSVPAIYTVANLEKVYYTLIPQACQEVTRDNIVLGINPIQASNYGFNLLINESRMIYLQRYAQTWEQVLANLSIPKPQNLNQSLQLVDALSDFHSPLLHLYSLVATNTAPNPNIPHFDDTVSKSFIGINGILSELTGESWQNAWRNLNQYLSSANNDELLFKLVANRMGSATYDDPLSQLFQKAPHYPEPLNTWSLQIATNTWQFLLSNTQEYLNQVWTNTVLPEYNATIVQRYPLFRDMKQEVSLEEFTQFFGPGGTLDEFVSTYIKPFIDNSNHYWAWKTIDGEHLNIPISTLDMFIRAALIQQAYFTTPDNQLQVHFQLIPISLTPTVHHFTLQLGEQKMMYEGGKKDEVALTWPGTQLNTIHVQFVNKQNKTSTFNAIGPWALFRLLDQSEIQTTNNPKQLEITFKMEGYAIKYRLEANSVINPFMPGILEGLHLPQQL
ncbi:MAG: ImcF-related family protein [Gammaproteobacteria bacterium]